MSSIFWYPLFPIHFSCVMMLPNIIKHYIKHVLSSFKKYIIISKIQCEAYRMRCCACVTLQLCDMCTENRQLVKLQLVHSLSFFGIKVYGGNVTKAQNSTQYYFCPSLEKHREQKLGFEYILHKDKLLEQSRKHQLN